MLVIIDIFTGFCITRALKTKDAETVAMTLWPILCDWGPPKVMQSDDGSEYCNKIVKHLASTFKMKWHISTPHSHQSVGGVERLNQTIQLCLFKMLQGAIGAWDVLLPYVTHLYNTTARSVTKSAPYALFFTRAANELVDPIELKDLHFDVDNWLQHQGQVLETVYPTIKETIQTARATAAKDFNKKHHIRLEPLPVGTWVLFRDEAATSKSMPKWTGPVQIAEITPNGSYILANGIQRALSALKWIPTPEENPQDDTFRMDFIVTHKGKKNLPDFLQYKVRWHGYTKKDDTWVLPKDILDKKTIDEYWKSKAPKRLTKRKREEPKKSKRNIPPNDSASAIATHAAEDIPPRGRTRRKLNQQPALKDKIQNSLPG
jgi:hypothetical protein